MADPDAISLADLRYATATVAAITLADPEAITLADLGAITLADPHAIT